MKFLVLVLLVFSLSPIRAGAAPAPPADTGLVAQVEVESRAVTVGSLIPITWWVELPANRSLTWPKAAPPGVLEIQRAAAPRRESVGKGRVRESLQVTFRSFEVGALSLAGPRVRIAGGDTAGVPLPAATILVRSVLPPNSKQADIHDIKGPAQWQRPLPAWVRWALLALGALGALALLAWAILKLVRARREALENIPYPERALRDLELLRKANLLQAGRQKEFHIRLTEILRRYLGERCGFEALDLTTAELLPQIAGALPEEREMLERLFESSDLVKFARQDLPPTLSEEFLEKAVQLVGRTRPREEAAA